MGSIKYWGGRTNIKRMIKKPPTPEEYMEAVGRTVDIYAPGGGSYLMMFNPDEELLWDACAENYYRSTEYYENVRPK